MQETIDAEAKRRELKLDENTFAIYTALDWPNSGMTPASRPGHRRPFPPLSRLPLERPAGAASCAASLYQALLNHWSGPDKMVAMANTLLRLERV